MGQKREKKEKRGNEGNNDEKSIFMVGVQNLDFLGGPIWVPC